MSWLVDLASRIRSLAFPARREPPKVFDFSERFWGHDYGFRPENGGLSGKMHGWHHAASSMSPGDFVILQNGPGATSRYRIVAVRVCLDPADMFFADVEFAPRRRSEGA